VDSGSRQNSLKTRQWSVGQGAAALVQPEFDKKLHHSPQLKHLPTVTLTLFSPIVKGPAPRSSGHAPAPVRLDDVDHVERSPGWEECSCFRDGQVQPDTPAFPTGIT
jgi:hypothetical protein